jgi:hypothetical protein
VYCIYSMLLRVAQPGRKSERSFLVHVACHSGEREGKGGVWAIYNITCACMLCICLCV